MTDKKIFIIFIFINVLRLFRMIFWINKIAPKPSSYSIHSENLHTESRSNQFYCIEMSRIQHVFGISKNFRFICVSV